MTTAKVVSITTNASGAASVELRLYGVITAIGVRLGTLSTPDVAITDGLTGAAIFTKAGIATDLRVQPRVLVQDSAGDNIALTYDKPAVTGMLEIVVAGGGNVKSGQIVIVHE